MKGNKEKCYREERFDLENVFRHRASVKLSLKLKVSKVKFM